jgi:putative NADH-flavin reductase
MARAKVAILGSTGRTGRELIGQALAIGMDVAALARAPSKLEVFEGKVSVVEGDATDPAATARLIAGRDAVLNSIGRDGMSPSDLMTTAARNVVAAMKSAGVTRYVVLGNTAIKDPTDRPPFSQMLVRFLITIGNRPLKRDSIAAAEVINESGLEWTIVRAPVLTEGLKTGAYHVGPLDKNTALRVSRADVADFMLSCITGRRFICERPAISSGRK